jgi:hypothetical protein
MKIITERIKTCARTGGMAQAVQHLPCKHKALSSNPHYCQQENVTKDHRASGTDWLKRSSWQRDVIAALLVMVLRRIRAGF